jgi:hypothetical protein
MSLLNFKCEFQNIFDVKYLKWFTFYVKLIDERKRQWMANNESTNLRQKVNL